MKTETYKIEEQREKEKKKQSTRTVEQVQTIKYSYRKYQRRREGENPQVIFEAIITEISLY